MQFFALFRARRLRAEGDAARDSRNWQEAARKYESYLHAVPNDAAIWVQLGHAQKESGDLKLAERCYCRALSIEPDNPDTHVQLGHVEKLKGNREQSLARYRKALEIDPSFPAALEECRFLNDPRDLTIDINGKGQPDESAIEHQLDDVWDRLEQLEGRDETARAVATEMLELREKVNEIDKRVDFLLAQLRQIVSSTTDRVS